MVCPNCPNIFPFLWGFQEISISYYSRMTIYIHIYYTYYIYIYQHATLTWPLQPRRPSASRQCPVGRPVGRPGLPKPWSQRCKCWWPTWRRRHFRLDPGIRWRSQRRPWRIGKNNGGLGIHVKKPPVDGMFRWFQMKNGVGFLVSPVFFVVLQVDLGILFCVFVYGLIILVTPKKWSLPPRTIDYLIQNSYKWWFTLLLWSIGSMYGIYGNIYHQYTPNVSIYTSTMDPSWVIFSDPTINSL